VKFGYNYCMFVNFCGCTFTIPVFIKGNYTACASRFFVSSLFISPFFFPLFCFVLCVCVCPSFYWSMSYCVICLVPLLLLLMLCVTDLYLMLFPLSVILIHVCAAFLLFTPLSLPLSSSSSSLTSLLLLW